MDLPVTFDASSTNANISTWGEPYDAFGWSERATAVDQGDGTWTVNLGELPRNSGTVFQFNVALGGTDFTPKDRFVASAEMRGAYAPGVSGGNCEIPDRPDLPEPSPDLEECTAEFLGQTLWTVYDRDITEHSKIQGEITSDELGEVNADGWGAGADAWGEGDTRTFRLYAATQVPLTDAFYVIDAVQGVTFATGSASAVSTPAAGALQGNGYVEQAEGVTVTSNDSGTQLVVSIDRMAAMSSFSVNVTGVLDGSLSTMALNHRLIGAVEDCAQPEPDVTHSEWVTSSQDCEAGTVTESREITTREFIWDRSTLSWVASEPVITTESRERAMTEAELAVCAQTPPPETESPPATAVPVEGAQPAGSEPGALSQTGSDGFIVAAVLSVMLGVLGSSVLLVRRRRS